MTDERTAAFTPIGSGRDDAGVFHQLLDSAPDAIVVVDDRGRMAFVNRQTETLFGYPREKLLGQTIEILVPERFRGSHPAHRGAFFGKPTVRPMGSGRELFGRRNDGTEFPVEISLSPLTTDSGLLVSAIIRDISERKESERQIRRVQEHLLGAIESIQGAFAIFDANDRLILCNSSYRELLGAPLRGEIAGRTYGDIVRANIDAGTFDLGEGSQADLLGALASYHRAPSGSFDARSSDRRRWRVVERKTADGGTLSTIWDVTEDMEREDELRRARTQAEAASSAKSEFLASMSHELRTPLNSILGFAQLLHRDKKTPLSERHRERIEHVLKGGEHLLRLIDDILDLARIEAGRVLVSPEPVEVAPVLAEIETTLGPIAWRAGIELSIAPVPPDLPELVADRTRFRQILMNFGSNSIKYGRRGGKVGIRASRDGGFVRVTVEDDGMGIAADKQDKIFQPFHRAGQETGSIEGTGIGLAITKQLAELMHGRVGFTSVAGRGSSFWIELPIHRPSLDAIPVSPSDAAKPESRLTGSHGPFWSVVYVEDNPSNIAFMRDLLSDFERVELITAPTAEIGIEIVRVRHPNAVIMDINLPGMSGFEATRILREWPETRDIPIIALSAAAMVRDSGRVADAGFYRYLTKPVKVDELTAVLEEILVDR
jgi:PAS domain S-box-containing protein